MTSPLYSELPHELLLDVEPMRPAWRESETPIILYLEEVQKIKIHYVLI